jgi:S1-C subfamily serine protease
LAIPINLIKQVLPALVRDRRLIRPWLGFHGQFVSNELRSLLNIPLRTGFLIEVIEPGSPAELAQLQGGSLEMTIAGHDFLFGGDIVTKMNNRALTAPDEVAAVLATLQVGSEVSMTVFRDGKSVDVKYVLPERPLLPGDIMGSEGEAWPAAARKTPALTGFRF